MRALPEVTYLGYPPILLVRTDYRDDDAWRRVQAALDQPWGAEHDPSRQVKEEILYVDDPQWADATPAEVLAALPAEVNDAESIQCGWAVVFLADAVAMEGTEPTLLAASTDPEETVGPFRVHARETPHKMHCNLNLGNLDFDEFAGEVESAP